MISFIDKARGHDMTDFNNIYSYSICLISGQLAKYDNSINNYDTSYKIIDNDTIRIKLKNYYEKMYFIARLEDNKKFLSLYSIDNNYINTCKIA